MEDTKITNQTNKGEKKFLMKRKHFFLTYPKGKGLEDKKQIKEMLLRKCKGLKANLMHLLIGYETGEKKEDSKEYEHFHSLLSFDRQVTVTKANFWDLGEVHGHYKGVNRTRGDLKRVENYVCKDMDVLEWRNTAKMTKTGIKPLKGNDLTTMRAILTEELAMGKSIQAIRDGMGDVGKAMLDLYGNRLLKNLTINHPRDVQINNFHFHLPQRMKERVEEWEEGKRQKVLFLMGISGVGKTSFARSLFTNPLMVNNRESFKSLDSKHDGIIMDDVSWREMTNSSREVAIHLLDVECENDIKVKHGHVRIPRMMPRVITSNLAPHIFLGYLRADDLPKEIKRRVLFVIVDTDLRVLKEREKVEEEEMRNV